MSTGTLRFEVTPDNFGSTKKKPRIHINDNNDV